MLASSASFRGDFAFVFSFFNLSPFQRDGWVKFPRHTISSNNGLSSKEPRRRFIPGKDRVFHVRSILFHAISRNGNHPRRHKHPRQALPPFLLVLLPRSNAPQPTSGWIVVVLMSTTAVRTVGVTRRCRTVCVGGAVFVVCGGGGAELRSGYEGEAGGGGEGLREEEGGSRAHEASGYPVEHAVMWVVVVC